MAIRQSTSTAQLADRDVHEALAYIRQNAHRPLSVEQVARAAAVSRRWLERHCRRALGRSPHELIRQARLDQARRLLLETDLPAVRIAGLSGFRSASYLNHAMRQQTGLTPAQFRRRYRLPTA